MRSTSPEPEPGEPKDSRSEPDTGGEEPSAPIPPQRPSEAGDGGGAAPEGDRPRETGTPGAAPFRAEDAGLPGRQLERIIRRAVELQFEVGEGRDDRIPEGEVIRIGREVGLDPQYVRRALAEYRTGALAGETPWEPDRLSTVLGPNVLRATRTVPGRPEELQRTLEDHFRSRESLQAVRRLPGISLWEPAGGVLSAAQRALNVHGLGYQLARARSMEVAITEVGEDRSLVTLTADVRNVRADSAWGWVFLGFLAIFAPPLLLGPLTELSRDVLLGLGVGVGGALALTGTRRNVRRETGRIRLVMEGLLDRLEAGDSLRDDPPSWRDRLLP